MEFIDALAAKIDSDTLAEAQEARDAVGANKIVFKALGLDDEFIRSVHASRR